jgi:hypothetical protein
MELTTFLASIWGPILLALGIGFLANRAYYTQFYRELDRQSFGMLLFSMFAIAFGIIQILAHNVWGTATEILISLLGWGLFLKGVVFAVAPRFVMRTANREAHAKLIPVVGVVMFILGLLLTWNSYFA